jgi:RNA-directed DNA polymerase
MHDESSRPAARILPAAVYDASKRRELGSALAAAFLAGVWNDRAMVRRGAAALDPRPRWLRPLVREVLAAYHRPPADRPRELAAYAELVLHEWRGARPAPRVRRWFGFEPGMARTPWPVPAIASPGALAARLGVDHGQLAWLADARGLERHVADPRLRHYTYTWLPRPGAPPRLIEAPKHRLKQIQRRILHEILDRVPAHEAAHGFVRGRSARTHAALHTGRAVVVRFDLEDFFASVEAARVYGIMRTAGYPEAVAHALTALCVNVVPQTEWDAAPRVSDAALLARRHRLGRRLATPHLPQGAPTSPALASLAAFGLDVRLTALARSLRLTYSRYADDLTFSGERPATRILRQAVAEIVRDEGFRLGHDKTRVRTRAARQLVCGAVVNERLNVPRPEYDRLKAIVHDAVARGPEAANRAGVPDFRAHLAGRIAWLAALNPERGRRLRDRLDEIRW